MSPDLLNPEAEAAPIFAALGDPTRLALLDRLSSAGPLSIARLSSGLPQSRQAITKHLQVLAGAGLVHDAHRGREHLWELAPDRLANARRYLDQVSQQWDAALGRLQSFVEDEGCVNRRLLGRGGDFRRKSPPLPSNPRLTQH
jgi:DNA-binding transcriptional ArsR family regulator